MGSLCASQAARKLVQEQKFDLMMTTGPPHSSHLVGLSVRKVFELPWVVDMRDPWVEIYYTDQMYERQDRETNSGTSRAKGLE